MDKKIENTATALTQLSWDTAFFGVTCAKAVLYKRVTPDEWKELQHRFKDFQFISIVNHNSEPVNAKIIGTDTSAFLVDVNMQFSKELTGLYYEPNSITIHRALDHNDQIVEMAEFEFSKFTDDLELLKRGGDQVYRQWVINSFNSTNKFFALSQDGEENLNGFVLYSFSGNSCVIELIAVSKDHTKSGVGTELFKAVEYAAYRNGANTIQVGTQVRNVRAINFYQKVGCRLVGSHQVYHWWNL